MKYNWKIKQNISQYEKYYADSQGQLVWTLENLDQIPEYIYNDLIAKVQEQKRTPLIYQERTLGPAILKLKVKNRIPPGHAYYVYQYYKNSQQLKMKSRLKRGLNRIFLNNLNNSSRLGIVLKSSKAKMISFDMEIISLIGQGRIPKKMFGIKQYQKEVALEQKDILEPQFKTQEHCGIPVFFLASYYWGELSSIFDQMGGLCQFVQESEFKKGINKLDDPGEVPPEPIKPQPPVFVDEPPTAPEKPTHPVEPERPVITEEWLRSYIIKKYNKHAYLNLENALRFNSAYLIDTSDSVKGNPLAIIKAELAMIADVLPPEIYMSIYPMINYGDQMKPFIENYQKVDHHDPGRDLIKAIQEIKLHADWDSYFYALKYALANEQVNVVNILSDTDYNDEYSVARSWQLNRIIKNRASEVTVNVYNFSDLNTSKTSLKLIELGTGKGEIIEEKKLNPRLANYYLNLLKRIRDPDQIEIVATQLMGNIFEKYEEEYEQFQENLETYQQEMKEYKELYWQWEQDWQQFNLNKQDYILRMREFEDLDLQWKKEYLIWERQMSWWCNKTCVNS